jgi:hypothetical protein
MRPNVTFIYTEAGENEENYFEYRVGQIKQNSGDINGMISHLKKLIMLS